MKEKGWFKVHRKIVESDIFNGNPYALKFWIWLLASAAYKETEIEKRGRYVTLERGDVCATLMEMAKVVYGDTSQRSKNRIGNIISNMKINGYINTETNSSYTLIHIENYGFYQNLGDEKSTVESTVKSTPKSTVKPTVLEKPTIYKKKNKEGDQEFLPLSEAEWDALDGELV